MSLWMIAKSNMKKKKGNVAALFLLVALSILLFYTGMNVLKNVDVFLDENYESQNGAHVVTVPCAGYEEQVDEIVEHIEGYHEHETEDALVMNSGVGEIKRVESDEKADYMSFIFLRQNQEREISDFVICDKGEVQKKNSIVLPMYLKVAKGYRTGEEISIKLQEKEYIFEIYGFVEDVMFASPSNISVYKCYIGDEMYEEFVQNEKALMQGQFYNIRIDNVEESATFEEEMVKQFAAIKAPGFSAQLGVNYSMMRGGTSMMVNILMTVLEVFSIMMVIIAIVVMRFNVIAAMEENLPNIGILEAVGYTSGQLRRAIVMEYMIITVSGIAAGLAFSGISSDTVAAIVSGSIGLQWKPKADAAVALIAIVVIVGLILTAVLMTSRKYKKISTLDALRDGIETHSFRRNHVPLHKSLFKVNTSLGLKGLLHGSKQNIAFGVIVLLLSYASVVMLMIYSNFVFDNKPLVDLVGLEKSDILMTVPRENLAEVREELEEDKDVASVISFGANSCNIIHDGKEVVVGADIYDDVEKLTVDTLLDGRKPKWENEINLTNVIAKSLDAELGDSVTMRIGEAEKNFVVVGITQQISNMGRRVMITEAAVKTLWPEYQNNTLLVYLKNTENISGKVEELKEYYQENEEIAISNAEENYNTVMGTFMVSIGALCIVLLLITIAVICLIIFLLVRMKLIRERKIMGVYKALGYTTPQLMSQTILSFIPVVGIGVLLGGIAAAFSLNSVFALCLSFSGIENCNMNTNAWVIVLTFAAITLMSLLVVTLGSWSIRKIEPYKMITE